MELKCMWAIPYYNYSRNGSTFLNTTPVSFGQQDLNDVATINKVFDQLSQATMVMPANISKLAKMLLFGSVVRISLFV